jgi:hypothetical protein
MAGGDSREVREMPLSQGFPYGRRIRFTLPFGKTITIGAVSLRVFDAAP